MKLSHVLVGITLGALTSAVTACEIPSLPKILPEQQLSVPARASIRIEMLRYLAGMSDYVSCIQAEYESVSAGTTSARLRSMLAARNNLAVAEVEATSDMYLANVGSIDDLPKSLPPTCIGPRSRVRSELIGENWMVFRPSNGEIYLSVLAECPMSGVPSSARSTIVRGLDVQGEYCVGGIVAVRGNPCTLGSFYPVADAEVEELRR